jgi:Flp pilus assembly protein TadD
MSHTLNLVAGVLATARDLAAAGRNQPAIDLLQRLAAFRQLAGEVAEEVHSRLADLYAELEQYKKARRHLTIALTFRPQHPAYHHRMGMWIEDDPDAAVGRAGQYYRRAVRGEPDNADYWTDYGMYLLTAGRTRAGRAALVRAFKLASHEVDRVACIAGALRDAGLWNDARRLLRRARFQHPRDRRYRALWQQHQFEQLCAEQRARARTRVPRGKGQPVVLPFLRTTPATPSMEVDGKIIRLDRAMGRDGATLPLPQRRPQNPRHRNSN